MNRNALTGGVRGGAAMVGQVHGGVHFHGAAGASTAEPRWPRRYGVVPPRADCFQPRAEGTRLAELTEPAARNATGSGSGNGPGAEGGNRPGADHGHGAGAAVVLSGPAGAGKTQLAADHVRRLSGDLDLLVWVTANSREAVIAAYASAYADLTGFGGGAELAAERFLAWLAHTPRRWLVVLDDVRAPADLNGLWPPGPVLATTRRRDAALRGAGRRILDVGLFSAAEAAAYLAARFAGTPRLLTGADGLAEDLGRLPLALAQASAYIIDQDLTCAQYRARLADRRRRLDSLLPERDALPDEHLATVAAAWSLSVERADRLEPAGLARPLLTVASVLDPNGAPEAVFTSPAVLEHLGEIVGRPVDAEQARTALRGLHRMNLVTHDPGTPHRAVRVHTLVQRAAREELGERLPCWAKLVADALRQVWPPVEEDLPLVRALRANTAALHRHTAGQRWTAEHELLFHAGNSLGESGQVAAATRWFHRLHRLTRQLVGADHPSTLTARHNAAYWRGETGDAAGAVRELERVLADQERVLGPRHPHALTTRHNMARWRGHAGEHARTVPELAAVLREQERVLGARHPDTLTTRHDLARWRGATGDATTAVTELERLLRDQIFALGPWHPNTLTTRHNLARWRGHAGDPAAAVTELARVLDDQVRVLGPWHPNILITCHNLVHWRMVLDGAAAL
ncbi:tetratricopeptide repeat protein [Crossiella sp. CA-258035]|uniref:tetratricopeptide repeat protein n=1 Tax=Crossiella sp. CA-258035 TaxID=2981138 RepID=UPI0024BCB793|nr:tetratricopeptide repeat protein [Crossiella sp. CA-258035]WHT21931.1 tetratricopeptide repeat protein [Crossiella sp. CA-258035]